MSKALYAGIEGIARKVKKMYMGEGYYGDESSDRAEVIAFE